MGVQITLTHVASLGTAMMAVVGVLGLGTLVLLAVVAVGPRRRLARIRSASFWPRS